MGEAPVARDASDASRGKVGSFTAACVLISNIVGGGIFTVTGLMARDLGDPILILAMAEREQMLHPWTAQIQITVLQAQDVGDIGVVFNHEGRRFGFIQHFDLLHQHFDISGSEVLIVRTIRTEIDQPGHGHDVLAAEFFALLVYVGRLFRVKYDLSHALSIA